MQGRRLAIGMAAVLAALPATDASAADTVVAMVPRATPVDVSGGHALWSAWDGKSYRLTDHSAGRTRALPVGGRTVPFDADVGSDAQGEPIAVYSRCRRAPLDAWALDGRRGCDLYLYRFASGRQSRITRANSTADEYFPAVWRGRLAFTRTYRNGQRRLYWRTLGRAGASHRLAGGPTEEPAVPRDLDIRGGTVAYVRKYEFGAELRTATTTGKGRRLVRVPGSGAAANQLTAQGPSLAGGNVYWMLSVGGDAPVWSRIRRVNVAAHGRQQTTTRIDADPSLPRATEGYGHDASGSWYVRDVAPDRFEVHRASGLRYEPADPIVLTGTFSHPG
jgi:hypothetical protein